LALRRAPEFRALYLAGAAGAIETLNGINHLAAAIVFRGYVPGVITAPLLLVLGSLCCES
jgi:Protein of unknown function with HXXEE motif